MSPGFWPLTKRGEAEINHNHGATKFGRYDAQYHPDELYFSLRSKRPCKGQGSSVTGVLPRRGNHGPYTATTENRSGGRWRVLRFGSTIKRRLWVETDPVGFFAIPCASRRLIDPIAGLSENTDAIRPLTHCGLRTRLLSGRGEWEAEFGNCKSAPAKRFHFYPPSQENQLTAQNVGPRHLLAQAMLCPPITAQANVLLSRLLKGLKRLVARLVECDTAFLERGFQGCPGLLPRLALAFQL